jgi:hypothetical protein
VHDRVAITASRRSLPMPVIGPRGKRVYGVIVFRAWRTGTPDSVLRNHHFCLRQEHDSVAVALDMWWRNCMSQGGQAGRSGGRLYTAGIRRGCWLWFYCPIGLSAETIGLSESTSTKRIMDSPPSSACNLRRIDQRGLALRIRKNRGCRVVVNRDLKRHGSF